MLLRPLIDALWRSWSWCLPVHLVGGARLRSRGFPLLPCLLLLCDIYLRWWMLGGCKSCLLGCEICRLLWRCYFQLGKATLHCRHFCFGHRSAFGVLDHAFGKGNVVSLFSFLTGCHKSRSITLLANGGPSSLTEHAFILVDHGGTKYDPRFSVTRCPLGLTFNWLAVEASVEHLYQCVADHRHIRHLATLLWI